jgi:hypothetical protein
VEILSRVIAALREQGRGEISLCLERMLDGLRAGLGEEAFLATLD